MPPDGRVPNPNPRARRRSYQCGVYPGNYSRFTSDWTQVYQTTYTPTIAPLPWFSVFGAHTLPARRCGSVWYDVCDTHVNECHALQYTAARAPAAAWAGFSADGAALRRAGNHDIVINGARPPHMPPCAACGRCTACLAPTVLS